MTRIAIVIAAGLALIATLPAVPAHALRARVFVSKVGADVGACSFSAPCQSLGYALSGVEPGGEITILDSGGYSPITITQGVTITVPPGVEAGIVPVSGGDAITISTGTGAVFLRGLTIDGSTGGNNGITVIDAPSLTIVDCVIRNFTHDGIHLGSSHQTIVSILNTITSNNGNDGIAALPGNVLRAVFNNVESINNGAVGFELRGSPGLGLTAAIVNSVASNNTGNGITVGQSSTLFLRNSLVSLNLNGVSSEPNGFVVLSNNSIVLNNSTDALLNGGNILTYGNNECFACSRSGPEVPF
jgi:Right handed beta helix region